MQRKSSLHDAACAQGPFSPILHCGSFLYQWRNAPSPSRQATALIRLIIQLTKQHISIPIFNSSSFRKRLNLQIQNLAMKRRAIVLVCLGTLSFTSCKKCYMCSCTDTTTLDGCTQLGEQVELCDKGWLGKTILTTRVLEKETEGYTCTVE
jgi:hypothetical protein